MLPRELLGVVADIKSKLSVLEVVGETVQLKRAGTAYKALCPFHAEKTPSFIVNPDRETWRCFGCGEGGDIFTFVMRRDGLDFREALERLAEKAGVELSERTAREDRERKRLRDALESAIAWYREVLLQANLAERARAYLHERGLTVETLDRFTIGYAPNTWDALVKRLVGKGYTNAELIGAGLASQSNRGGVIDKFRGRIVIPIRDSFGRAVASGAASCPARTAQSTSTRPRPASSTSRALYGIDLAKTAIRARRGLNEVIMREGYTRRHGRSPVAGFANVQSPSLGTAAHPQRGRSSSATPPPGILSPMRSRSTYDLSTSPGEAATQRGLRLRGGGARWPRPGGEPLRSGSCAFPARHRIPSMSLSSRDRSGEAWTGDRRRSAAGASTYFHGPSSGRRRSTLSSVTGRREVTRPCSASCAGWGMRSSRRSYLQRLSRLVDVDEKVLTDELAATPRPATPPAHIDEAGDERERVDATLPALEAEALRVLLRYPATRGEEARRRAPPHSARLLRRPWRGLGRAPGRGDPTRPRSKGLRRRGSTPPSARAGPQTCWPTYEPIHQEPERPRARRGARCAPQLACEADACSASRMPSAGGRLPHGRGPTATGDAAPMRLLHFV